MHLPARAALALLVIILATVALALFADAYQWGWRVSR